MEHSDWVPWDVTVIRSNETAHSQHASKKNSFTIWPSSLELCAWSVISTAGASWCRQVPAGVACWRVCFDSARWSLVCFSRSSASDRGSGYWISVRRDMGIRRSLALGGAGMVRIFDVHVVVGWNTQPGQGVFPTFFNTRSKKKNKMWLRFLNLVIFLVILCLLPTRLICDSCVGKHKADDICALKSKNHNQLPARSAR